jgi:small subunit ribosomal protein S4e
MTKKGSTKVLKTQCAGKVFKVDKKKTFVLRPAAGKHTLLKTVTVGYVLRDILHLTENNRESTRVIRHKDMLVDKKPIKSINYAIGLFDIIELPRIKKSYKVTYKQNGLITLIEIGHDETKHKVCKIIKKIITKKGQIQLITNDGRTVLTTNQAYKTKASIKLDLEDNTIKEYYPLEKGRKVFLIGGKHIGKTGTIVSVKKGNMIKKELVKLKIDDKEFETTEKNVFVIN